MLTISQMEANSPSADSVDHILDQISAVKQELASHGVQEQDIPKFMPGVIATNIGMPLPVPHCGENGPVLPKGLMAHEDFNAKVLHHTVRCEKAKEDCHDLALELKEARLTDKWPATWPGTLVGVIKNKLDCALNAAGHYAAAKTRFYLDYTPCDAEAFYAKITPLINKYESLAEQLKDAKRDLV